MLPERDLCTGCGACAAVCPKDCITMTGDAEGFLYPKIDQARCVDCKQCEKICPVFRQPKVAETVQFVAARNTDSHVRQESSSGGVFTAVAQEVLREGGAVCAAVYNEDFGVEHRIAFTVEELAPMRGAKYVQSHAGHLFRNLKALLTDGKPVMFVGTPCQCAALRSYLGREYENLLLVDLICHGVPAPGVWSAYLDRRRKLDADGQNLTSVNLRDKTTGWSRYAYSVRIGYSDGTSYLMPQQRDRYMNGFVGNLFLRPSCGRCSFKGIGRCSDLTLGDCWGIWDSHPEFDDNKGTSLLMIQSPKGQRLWNSVCHGFDTLELTEEAVTKYNPSAMYASEPRANRAEFFARLEGGEPLDELLEDLLAPKTPPVNPIKAFLHRLLKR